MNSPPDRSLASIHSTTTRTHSYNKLREGPTRLSRNIFPPPAIFKMSYNTKVPDDMWLCAECQQANSISLSNDFCSTCGSHRSEGAVGPGELVPSISDKSHDFALQASAYTSEPITQPSKSKSSSTMDKAPNVKVETEDPETKTKGRSRWGRREKRPTTTIRQLEGRKSLYAEHGSLII